jgi:hypothetical protein
MFHLLFIASAIVNMVSEKGTAGLKYTVLGHDQNLHGGWCTILVDGLLSMFKRSGKGSIT